MAVSLVSTGIQFPDSTIQTTAATSSGSPITTNSRQAITSSATTSINFASGNTVDLTMASNITTLNFSGVASSGTAMIVQIVVRNASSGTAYTIVWPSSVYWGSQSSAGPTTAPTLASGANGVTTVALLTTDGGTKWRGWVDATINGGPNGNIYQWGLTIANATATSSPITQLGTNTWYAITQGGGHSGIYWTNAIKTDGTLWSWGQNNYGNLGLGTTTNYSSPKQVGGLTTWTKVVASGGGGSSGKVLALQSNGTMWSWGKGSSGQLGVGNGTDSSSPRQIGSLTTWADVGGCFQAGGAIKTDGTLWTWGSNGRGQLGRAVSSYAVPVQVGTLTNWSRISNCQSAYNSYTNAVMGAVKTDGTLWMWGWNGSANLGIGNYTNYSSPKQVGAATNWKYVSVGNGFTLAVTTSGTAWAWGSNSGGQLGLGDTSTRPTPVQIGTLTNWAAICAGYKNTLATKTDGTFWAWGYNGYSFSLPTFTRSSSPIQVGTATTWGKSMRAITTMGDRGGSALGNYANVNPA